MDLLALCVFVFVVGESFREDEGRGFGEDFSFTCRDDRSGSTESFRYEGVVPAGFRKEMWQEKVAMCSVW